MDSPLALGNFRLNSLLVSLYRLFAKVLAARLVTVIWKLISLKQTTFSRVGMTMGRVL